MTWQQNVKGIEHTEVNQYQYIPKDMDAHFL